MMRCVIVKSTMKYLGFSFNDQEGRNDQTRDDQPPAVNQTVYDCC